MGLLSYGCGETITSTPPDKHHVAVACVELTSRLRSGNYTCRRRIILVTTSIEQRSAKYQTSDATYSLARLVCLRNYSYNHEQPTGVLHQDTYFAGFARARNCLIQPTSDTDKLMRVTRHESPGAQRSADGAMLTNS
jgi:hypothetical protein